MVLLRVMGWAGFGLYKAPGRAGRQTLTSSSGMVVGCVRRRRRGRFVFPRLFSVSLSFRDFF